MRNQHGTSPRHLGKRSMAGRKLENSLQERALTWPHSFWVNPSPVVRGQRQPEVSGYRSPALFPAPIAGAIQTSISTMSVVVRDKMAMSTCFTSDSGLQKPMEGLGRIDGISVTSSPLCGIVRNE
jgi:hypothetical protein